MTIQIHSIQPMCFFILNKELMSKEFRIHNQNRFRGSIHVLF